MFLVTCKGRTIDKIEAFQFFHIVESHLTQSIAGPLLGAVDSLS
jgi:hypothetical protein